MIVYATNVKKAGSPFGKVLSGNEILITLTYLNYNNAGQYLSPHKTVLCVHDRGEDSVCWLKGREWVN